MHVSVYPNVSLKKIKKPGPAWPCFKVDGKKGETINNNIHYD